MQDPSKNPLSRSALVRTLTQLLNGGRAHVSFSQAVEGLPLRLSGVRPPGVPYSIYQQVEHIRITQWDILAFCRDAHHESPRWPEGYWPREVAPARGAAWEKSLSAIDEDRDAFIRLLNDPARPLGEPFSYGQGQTLFSSALLIADHTSYHTGEILVLRRLLDSW